MIDKDIRERVIAIIGRLVIARKQAGLTQAQAAQKLGLAHSSMSHYESSLRGIDLPLLLQLCDIYDVSPAWVLMGSNPNFNADAWYAKMRTAHEDLNRDLRKVAALLETMDWSQPEKK